MKNISKYSINIKSKFITLFVLIFLSTFSFADSEEIECLKTKDNYLDKTMLDDYNKEKTIYFELDSKNECGRDVVCSHLLTNTDKWEFIEIKLKANEIGYPKEDGLYKISKDYSLENCYSKMYLSIMEEMHDKDNKKYCIRSEKIDKVTSNIKFYRYKTENNITRNKTIIDVENKIIFKEKEYANIYTKIIIKNNMTYICKKNMDDKYKTIFENN